MKKFNYILGAVLMAILGVLAPLKFVQAEEFAAKAEGFDAETGESDKEAEEFEEEISDKIPEVYIKAINPGYTTELGSNVGEMIEIARKNADEPISLAGAAVGYTNSSGNESVLLEFPENSRMTGETILLRLASSPDSELANVVYTKTLAMSGGIKLMMGEEIIDEVCWTGKAGCAKAFKSATPTTLVRNLETGEWEHVGEYEPDFEEKNYQAPESETEAAKGEAENAEGAPQCKGVQFSELLSYFEETKAEQFIELHNPKTENVRLDGCVVRYKNKNHVLSGTIEPDGYFAYYPEREGFSLTKNPTSSNELSLIDVNGAEVDKLVYQNGQRKATSYAWIGYDEGGEETWRVTYTPTPGEPNNYQEFKVCEIGKVLNKATGNCVKATTTAVKTCKPGYVMNPLTGRCNKIKTATTSECKEGYYRDPTTNRCRKIKENNGANYGLAPTEYAESSSFIALYAVLGVAAVGGVYLIYEFRHEIAKAFRKSTRWIK